MRIKELINRFRNRGDPRIEIELDLERIMEIVGEETEIFENLYLTRKMPWSSPLFYKMQRLRLSNGIGLPSGIASSTCI